MLVSSDGDLMIAEPWDSPVHVREIPSDEEPARGGISLNRPGKRKFIFLSSDSESDAEMTCEDAKFTDDSEQAPSNHLQMLQNLRLKDDEADIKRITKYDKFKFPYLLFICFFFSKIKMGEIMKDVCRAPKKKLKRRINKKKIKAKKLKLLED